MYRMVYVSRAACNFGHNDFSNLLEISQKNNGRSGIQGLLLFSDGHFIQMLQGDKSTVQLLYEAIRRDRRHIRCNVLFSELTEEYEASYPKMGIRIVPEYVFVKVLPEIRELTEKGVLNDEKLKKLCDKVRILIKSLRGNPSLIDKTHIRIHRKILHTLPRKPPTKIIRKESREFDYLFIGFQ